jgi:SAM-dependent methyltransferase
MPSSACSSSYDRFAGIYDRCIAGEFCRRVWPSIERLWVSRLPEGAHVLDLCCGSGQMARTLTECGYRVTGLDASVEMLRLARQNAPKAEFILADARSFVFPRANRSAAQGHPNVAGPIPRQHFHGALCAFNSLAHLESIGELELVFRNVRAALLPGATFLFDLNMEEAYTSKWRGSFRFVAGDSVCVIKPSYDPGRHKGRNRVTVTHRNQQSEFCIEQRCYSERSLRTALRSAGFAHIEVYEAQRDLGIAEESGRSFFLCA